MRRNVSGTPGPEGSASTELKAVRKKHALSKCEKASTYTFHVKKGKASTVVIFPDRNDLSPKDRGRLQQMAPWSSTRRKRPSKTRDEVDGA